MKLHLPLSLLSAVLLVAAGLSSRAQAVEVPSNYTPPYLADPNDLYGYRTTSGNHAFLLDGSITFTPSSATWWTSSQELKENGSILFTIEEDSAPYSLTFEGGANKAFYNVSTLAIEDIGRVTFEGLKESNYDKYSSSYSSYSSYSSSSSSSYYYYYYGGAIHAATLRLKGNSRVTFTGNEVIANVSSNNRRNYAYGGAIYGANGASITITETSGAVTFAQNKATSSSADDAYSDSYGGAIYGADDSTISICDNEGDVSFTGNYSSAYSDSYGGAIYGGSSSTISICGNWGDVNITDNSSAAFSSRGGAIYGGSSSTISICDNEGNVNITGNSSSSSGVSYGGAIYGGNSSTISISSNTGDVNITGNSSAAFSSHGGAIYGYYSTISISGNAGAVNITENTASAYSYSHGGAIYGYSSTISICDNEGDVSFTGNSSSSSSASALGGAIYSQGSLYLQNNGNTLIAGNYEKKGSKYRLRSIYMISAASDGGHFHLSAAAGKSIEFRDTVYIDSGSIVELNADYTDSESNVIKQEGDIIFTGAYTETHLNELLTANGAGRTATAEEIANSRSSEMHGKVTLYGGTLRVEEQAVLTTTAGLDVAAGSNASVKVSNAELDAGSSNINVGDSGTLTLMNGATVKAANINIADGASFEGRTSSSQEAVATFSLREAASVAEPPQSCLVDANLTLEAGSTLVADGVYFSMTEGSTLTFKALTGGDKINLVLTLGAEYSDNDQVVLFSDVDVVRFILDGVELNVTDTILANTFFTGAWVNDETTLSYDSSSGTISLQHLNTVAVPEPTTATLSLLALAALAARRRRRK